MCITNPTPSGLFSDRCSIWITEFTNVTFTLFKTKTKIYVKREVAIKKFTLLESIICAKISTPSHVLVLGELGKFFLTRSSAKFMELVMDDHMDSNIDVAATSKNHQ
jgi:hypothetical protein